MAGRRIPSLNWLRVFETAARAESFARAAETLNMSPPAVSQQIRALETSLGRPLFERGAAHVRLTEAGRAFLPVVANALASVETTAAGLFGRDGRAPLTLRVSTMLALSWLAPRLPGFMAAHPAVELTLVTGNLDEDFQRRGADLMITFGQPPGPGEAGEPLFGERLYPVASPALAARIATPADLAAERLIEVTSHRAGWHGVLTAAGLGEARPRHVFTDTTALALALAAAGGGVALARAPASDNLVAGHGLQRCLAPLEVPGAERYHLVHPAGPALAPAAAAFRGWVLAELTDA
ncbi:MAG: LysR substrate-binding domain-containing protein [Pseudomonadota bacterium]